MTTAMRCISRSTNYVYARYTSIHESELYVSNADRCRVRHRKRRNVCGPSTVYDAAAMICCVF